MGEFQSFSLIESIESFPIETLHVKGMMQNVSKKFMMAFFRRLTNLTELILEHRNLIEIINLLQEHPKLRKITLNQCYLNKKDDHLYEPECLLGQLGYLFEKLVRYRLLSIEIELINGLEVIKHIKAKFKNTNFPSCTAFKINVISE